MLRVEKRDQTKTLQNALHDMFRACSFSRVTQARNNVFRVEEREEIRSAAGCEGQTFALLAQFFLLVTRVSRCSLLLPVPRRIPVQPRWCG